MLHCLFIVSKISLFSMIFLDVLGYILGRDIFAQEPYPPFAASVKDGYAVVGNADLNITL